MKSNNEIYEQSKEYNIRKIINKLERGILNINDLNNTQKDNIIQYYNTQIYIKKSKVIEMIREIKGGK